MAYNASDLATAVQDDLGDASFSTSRLYRYLNRAQSLIFNTHTLLISEASRSVTLVVGEYTVAQATDHDSTIGGALIDPDNSNNYWLLDESTYMPHREFFAAYPNPDDQDNAMPDAWTEYAGTIYFNTPVDKTYELKQRYHRLPTDVVDDTDTPDLPEVHRELLEQYMLYRAEKYRGNHDVAATYKQDFEDGLEAMAIRYAHPSTMPYQRRQTRARINA